MPRKIKNVAQLRLLILAIDEQTSCGRVRSRVNERTAAYTNVDYTKCAHNFLALAPSVTRSLSMPMCHSLTLARRNIRVRVFYSIWKASLSVVVCRHKYHYY